MNIWNEEIIDNKTFSEILKLEDVTPIFKKDEATQPRNYIPVSVPPSISTIVDKIYWHNYEKRCCSCSHKQCKTLLRDHMGEIEDNVIIYVYIKT